MTDMDSPNEIWSRNFGIMMTYPESISTYQDMAYVRTLTRRLERLLSEQLPDVDVTIDDGTDRVVASVMGGRKEPALRYVSEALATARKLAAKGARRIRVTPRLLSKSEVRPHETVTLR